MNRIKSAFKKNKPFIGYLTAGDGGIDYSVDCMMALVRGGVNIMEIGFPYSDPIADGPVIQRAHQRALEYGTTSKIVLEIAKRIRNQSDIPLILFSYFNPLLQLGKEFLLQVKGAGFDGVLAVDWTLTQDEPENDFYLQIMKKVELEPILLATPSTSDERLSMIGKAAGGFLYYVTQKGTTGVRTKMAEGYAEQVKRLRSYTNIPIAAGFGIGDRSTAQAALDVADGFVVGSAFTKLVEAKVDPLKLALLANEIDPRVAK